MTSFKSDEFLSGISPAKQQNRKSTQNGLMLDPALNPYYIAESFKSEDDDDEHSDIFSQISLSPKSQKNSISAKTISSNPNNPFQNP